MPNHIFFSEVIGTGLLILLGDGVVAGVLLSKSKAENSGWIVITFGWGMAVAMARLRGRSVRRRAPQPGGDTRARRSSASADCPTSRRTSAVSSLERSSGRCWCGPHYSHHWQGDRGPRAKLAVFCTGPAIRNPAFNFISEVIGTFVLVFGVVAITRRGNDLVGRTRRADHRPAGLCDRPLARWSDGLRDQPCPRSHARIAHFVLPIPGKGSSDWEYAWIPLWARSSAASLGAIVAHQLPIGLSELERDMGERSYEWRNTRQRSIRARPARASWSSTTAARSSPSTRRSTSRSIPKPGWVEHDPLEIWQRTQEVVAGALEQGRLDAGDIAAVGITNQRETTVVWDRKTGEPSTTRSSGRTRAPTTSSTRARRGRRPGPLPRQDRAAARDLLLRPEAPLDPRQRRRRCAQRAESGDAALRHHRHLADLEPHRRHDGGCTSPT